MSINDRITPQPRAIIMGGLPGSGKSTEAQEIADAYRLKVGEDAVICSADHVFETPEGYKFDRSKIRDAHRACRQKFDDALAARAGLIIVDNTNTQRWEYQPYVQAAKQAGYKVELRRRACQDEKTLRKYHARCVHDVPYEHMLKMWKRWED